MPILEKISEGTLHKAADVLLGSKRIPEPVFIAIVSALMGTTAGYFVKSPILLTFLYLLPILFLERMSASPKFIAFCTIKNSYIALAMALATIFSALLVGLSLDPKELHWSFHMYAFFIIGFLIGVLLRHSIRKLSLAVVFGRKRMLINILICALWTIALIMFPHDSPDNSLTAATPLITAAPGYLLGMSAGIIISKGIALALSRAAAGYRRIQDIDGAWRETDADARPNEMEALKLLSFGRQIPSMKFKRLRQFLESVRADENSEFTKKLALISASVYRLEGQYDRAIEEASIADLSTGQPEDGHLALLRILSLEERGEEDKATEELKMLAAAKCATGCPVTAATQARRKAEKQLAIFAEDDNTLNNVEPSRVALEEVWKAMDRRIEVIRKREVMRKEYKKIGKTQKIDLFLARFAEIGVPVSPSWLTDTIGLCHLAAGYSSEAALYFKKCIGTDPAYSQAYLHLGDYYLFRNALLDPKATPKKSDKWHAKICYLAVQMVEVNPNGRTHRLANLRLQLLARL